MPSACSEVSIYGLLETALGWSPRRGLIVRDGRLTAGPPRSITKRPLGKARNQHIPLPSTTVFHKRCPLSQPLGCGCPCCCPQRVGWWDQCHLPPPSLPVPSCPSAHLTYLWDLGVLCGTPAPLRAPKPLFTLAAPSRAASEPLPQRPYNDTVWPSAFHAGRPQLHVCSSLPGSRGDRTPGPRSSCRCVWEVTTPGGTGHLQRNRSPGKRDGTPESLVNWPAVCPRLLQGGESQALCFSWDPHIFFCGVGQAPPLFYQSRDAGRDETFSWSPGRVWPQGHSVQSLFAV